MPIHPTAVIGPECDIHPSVEIGPNTVIEGRVSIGPDTRIYHNVTIYGTTTIGARNTIHMGAVIGHEPQDLVYDGCESGVNIGNDNVIREYVTIHRGTKKGTKTVIGNSNYLMALSHAAHNCRIHNHVILANNVLLAGYVEVEDRAFISGGAVVHQFVRIGSHVMVGGLSRVNKDIPPYMMLVGDSVTGINAVGLRRNGFSPQDITAIKGAYKIVFRSGLSTKSALGELRNTYPGNAFVEKIVFFIESSQRGLCKGPRG